MWPQVASEAEAAEAYAQFTLRAFEHRRVIGHHRCQYVDRVEPVSGALKQGLLREDETPYEVLVERVRRTNREIAQRVDAL